jgi:tripartite-type tricarboxylate transporter receptor subunit TctC
MNTLQNVAIATLIAGELVAVMPAGADAYPTKPVRVITGSPGSMSDIVTRQVGQRFSERWSQAVVVENRGGAGLTIGSAIAAKSRPDGYTLLMADRTSHAAAPSLYKELPYDPVKDFTPITLVARAPSLLVAHPSVPAANLADFIAYARKQPGVINYTAAGPGTGSHMTGELFKQLTGLNLGSVQYKGGGAAILAVVSGEVKIGFNTVLVALPQLKAGKLNAYLIASNKRFASVPDIPTAAEAGVPGFESEYWIGLFVPANTPASLVSRLNYEAVEVLQSPAMRDALLTQGAEPAPGRPAEFAAFIRNETVKLKKVIEVAGIRAE